MNGCYVQLENYTIPIPIRRNEKNEINFCGIFQQWTVTYLYLGYNINKETPISKNTGSAVSRNESGPMKI